MNQPEVIVSWIAGLLQIFVAGWAFRLTRLFGTTRVGWSLFTAFSLLALAHLIQSVGLLSIGKQLVVEIQVVYALISLLLIVSLAHIENVLKERQRMERQAKKMELVGQLTAGVAHDFNNILTVIQGYADLLTPKQHDAGAKEELYQISLAVKRCVRLSWHLLLFGRRKEIQLETLDLNAVVKNLTPMLGQLIGEDVLLQNDYGPELPSIVADVNMIEQIIMNLAVNARDAMTGGGTLTIRTAAATVDEAHARRHGGASTGEFVCLSVCDTGTGMTPDVLSRISEPFFTTKDIGKDTGLGLSTVYGIVKQHSGWVEVHSQVGKGTEFKVYFAAVPPESTEIRRKRDAQPILGGTETILFVEDEEPVRKLVGQIMKQNGYQVLEADNGAAALKIWEEKSSQIDLLVTDMVMPGGISGRDLGKQLLKAKPGLGVVYTSGYDTQRRGQDPASLPGVRFVPKPYASSDLLRSIRACSPKIGLEMTPRTLSISR